MANPGKAKAGRLGSSENGLETDGLAPADGSVRAGSAEASPIEPDANGQDFDPAAQLWAHLGQFAFPQPSQFSPLEALKSRLGEFQHGAGAGEVPFSTVQQEAGVQEAPLSEPYRTDLAWFEK